ncbi:hypothetical protein O3M35_006228 [Rhynocoris fuscipes]|uniref:Uncharacterized protein n=1 Tax=Rhynocoris fuscipes TaxID=488301 RepID=A0AAW1DHV3_9HEMI
MSRTLALLLLITVIYLAGCVYSSDSHNDHHTRAKRLTTFGKSPNNDPPPLVGKGKECKTDKDCEVILYTTCTVDHRDQRRRCICKDGNPPSNGQCQNRPRGLREPCRADAECLEGAECKINPNSTSTNHRQTVCLCREGRIEIGNQCNGSEKNTEGVSLVLLGLAALITVARRN